MTFVRSDAVQARIPFLVSTGRLCVSPSAASYIVRVSRMIVPFFSLCHRHNEVLHDISASLVHYSIPFSYSSLPPFHAALLHCTAYCLTSPCFSHPFCLCCFDCCYLWLSFSLKVFQLIHSSSSHPFSLVHSLSVRCLLFRCFCMCFSLQPSSDTVVFPCVSGFNGCVFLPLVT